MNFKWSAEDNMIAKAELQMSVILTCELRARPEIRMHLLFVSLKVRAKIDPILEDLTRKLNRPLVIRAIEGRIGSNRTVMVQVEDAQGAKQP